jgi:vacuolar protein sorting-associated protein 54
LRFKFNLYRYDVSSMSMVMQEQLSHHLDTIEVHLLREIGSRSDSFFEALGVLQELNAVGLALCTLFC